MKREALIVFALAGLIGCNGGAKQEGATKATFDTGLKKTEIKEVAVGKPSRFNLNQKPTETGDRVWVRYTGRLSDGSVFDSNDPKEKEAEIFSFVIGNGEVIKGWDIGLVGMLPGGKRKLSVPWKEAYGEAGRGVIPAKADLFFDIELMEAQKPSEMGVYDVLDLKKGSGPEVTKTSKVTINVVVTMVGGKLVESSYERKKPETFKMGNKEVLPALEDGILGMRQGGIRELRLPPEVGFPPGSGVSANMITYVKIELVKVG